jgi:hypothetical protein
MTRPSKTRTQFLTQAGQPERVPLVALAPDPDGPVWAFAQAAVRHVVIRRPDWR